MEFSKWRGGKFKYLEKIIIPQGSRVLWGGVHSIQRESEVILPLNSEFRVLEECEDYSLIDSYSLYEIRESFFPKKIFLYLKNYIKSSDKKVLSPPSPNKGKLCLVEYIP